MVVKHCARTLMVALLVCGGTAIVPDGGAAGGVAADGSGRGTDPCPLPYPVTRAGSHVRAGRGYTYGRVISSIACPAGSWKYTPRPPCSSLISPVRRIWGSAQCSTPRSHSRWYARSNSSSSSRNA